MSDFWEGFVFACVLCGAFTFAINSLFAWLIWREIKKLPKESKQT